MEVSRFDLEGGRPAERRTDPPAEPAPVAMRDAGAGTEEDKRREETP
jgi:hypothetical protein